MTSSNSYYEKTLATGAVRCIDDEIPFDIPQGWEWERWGNISFSIQYGYNAPAIENGDVRMVRISDIQDNKVLWHGVPFCKIAAQEIPNYILEPNDILFARTGGTVGKSFLVETVPVKAIYAGYLIRTRYSNELSPFYLKSFMESSIYWEQLKAGTIATAQPNCNGKTLGKMLLPIPPKHEQERIVSKLIELTPLIENYRVYEFSLRELNDSINESLRKSILQEAIQGRLVPQIDSEGTAEELLEEIYAEKKRLVKEGKLKKSAIANESRIFRGDDNKYYEQIGSKTINIDEQIPFDIPNSWCWIRLGYIIDFSSNSSVKVSNIEPDSWILDLEDIEKDSSRLLQRKRMSETGAKSDKHRFSTGNILYSKLRPYLNKVLIADMNGYCTSEILVFDFGKIYAEYALAYLRSPFFVEYAMSDAYGVKMPRLGSKQGNNALMPIPPLDEQHRIVNKIKQLDNHFI